MTAEERLQQLMGGTSGQAAPDGTPTPPPGATSAPLGPAAPGGQGQTAPPPADPNAGLLAHLYNWVTSSKLPSLPPGGFNPATPTQMARGLPVISDFDQTSQPQPPPTAKTGDGGYWTPRIVQGVLGGLRSGASLPGDVAKGQVVPSDPDFAGRTADLANVATLGMGISESPWQAVKRWTPSDAFAATAEAQKTAEARLGNMRVPYVKTPGESFQINAQTNPSVADLLEQQRWAASVPPAQDPAGALPFVQRGISQALAPGTPAGMAVQQAQTAAQRAQNAQTLERWATQYGLPGVDVQAEAADALKGYPVGSPQFNALRNIAAAKPAERGVLGSLAKSAVSPVATGVGEIAGHVFGIPGGGVIGATTAEGLRGALERLQPKGIAPVVQQEIAKAYGPLTGQPVQTGSALSRALMSLYSAARPP